LTLAKCIPTNHTLYSSFYSSAPLLFSPSNPATTKPYTLSLHDALPISGRRRSGDTSNQGEFPHCCSGRRRCSVCPRSVATLLVGDRKSTRLNSSHVSISYAVFCLKKKTTIQNVPLLPYNGVFIDST